jgi:hypothetical protein
MRTPNSTVGERGRGSGTELDDAEGKDRERARDRLRKLESTSQAGVRAEAFSSARSDRAGHP